MIALLGALDRLTLPLTSRCEERTSARSTRRAPARNPRATGPAEEFYFIGEGNDGGEERGEEE